jgi:hypothetical protein
MKNQIEIVKDIADGMYGIGGIPNNEEFYAEFDIRVKAALGITPVIKSVCDHDIRNFKDRQECEKCGEIWIR